MFFNSFLELFTKGGYTLLLLILCSIWSLTVIIEKSITLKGISKIAIQELKLKIYTSLKNMDLQEAIAVSKSYRKKVLFGKIKSPLSSVFSYIFKNIKEPKAELLESAYKKLDVELITLEKGLGVLSTLGAVSPFIGLFGTVLGIIKSFQALSINEASSYLNVMEGIAQALITTAAGLAVAVPAVVFYNYYTKKIKKSIPLLEEAIDELVKKFKSSEKQ